jgi:hypothetical protein
MKRGTEDSAKEDGGRKKRVRFDPEVRDNEPESSGEPVVKTPRRLRNKDTDGLDVLGRQIGDAGTSKLEGKAKTLFSKH